MDAGSSRAQDHERTPGGAAVPAPGTSGAALSDPALSDAALSGAALSAPALSAPASSREAALEVARFIDEHKGENTVVLDIGSVSSFADYFVISTARSSAHLSGLHRELDALLKQRGIRPRGGHKAGGESGWLLLDCGDFVVHLMEKEQREFYDLERLWFKAERLSYWSKSS